VVHAKQVKKALDKVEKLCYNINKKITAINLWAAKKIYI
jgi:hypothetical protein